MEIARRTAAIKPVLGVIPPSRRSLDNSMRCAPPCSAAIADSTESTHTSRMKSLFMMLASARNAPSGQANQIYRPRVLAAVELRSLRPVCRDSESVLQRHLQHTGLPQVPD